MNASVALQELTWLTFILSMCLVRVCQCNAAQKSLKCFSDQRFLYPIPHQHSIKHTHTTGLTLFPNKSCPSVVLPFPPFFTWLWLSCSPSVMVIYISEKNKAMAVEPKRAGEGHRCLSRHPPPCHIQLSLLIVDGKGEAECRGWVLVVVVVIEGW